MKNKERIIGAIIGGIIALLSGLSAIGFAIPLISGLYQVFLATPLEWIVLNFVDPLLGKLVSDESSGWILLPILMAIVGAIYGYFIGWLIQYLKSKKQ